MAKLHEETIVITVSKLLKNSETETTILSPETVESLEQVVQQLAGEGSVVEVQVA